MATPGIDKNVSEFCPFSVLYSISLYDPGVVGGGGLLGLSVFPLPDLEAFFSEPEEVLGCLLPIAAWEKHDK